MNELEKLKEHENLLLMNNDLWWSKEDLTAYDYLEERVNNDINALLPFLKNKNVAIQAGGHCGYVAKVLDRHFENLYVFEPNSSMFLALCMNLSNKNIFKFQSCLGNEHQLVGMEKFIKDSAGADFVRKDTNGKTPMLRIDDLNLNQCDLIMLDIEGYEYYALLGAFETISKFKPVLYLERCWGSRTTGLPESEIDKVLDQFGYKEVKRTGDSDRIYIVE